MKNTLKEQIEMIMEDFNFKEVHDIMKLVNWKWKTSKAPASVPPIEDLKSIALKCLTQAANLEDKYSNFSIGPFEAERTENILELKFVLQRANPLGHLLNSKTKDELARKS